MPETVTIRFTPPFDNDIVELKLYEATTKDGLYSEIDSTTDIGTYPDYVGVFTTLLANSETNWFAITWTNDDGDESELSQPVQGGTESITGVILRRVLERNPGADTSIVVQEAQAAIWSVLGTLDVDVEDLTPLQLSGITYLTLARVYASEVVTESQSSSYVAGLISEKNSDSKTTESAIQKLMDLANADLGRNMSVVMLMEDVQIGYSTSRWQLDQSRLIREIEVL